MYKTSRSIGTALALWLAAAIPAFADQFPGKGEEKDWLQACNICNQGVPFMQAGRYAEAFKCFEKAIEIYPYDPVFFFDLGVAHQQFAYRGGARQAELTDAETNFSKACTLKADKPDIWLHLANVQNDLGKYADSLKCLQNALELPTISPQDRQASLTAMAGLKMKLGSVMPPASSAGAGAMNAPSAAVSPADAVSSVATVAPTAAIPALTPAQISAPAQQTASWQTYGGLSDAFTMKYPNGWHVTTDPQSGRIDVADAAGAQLSVLPFSSPTPIDAAQVSDFFNGFMKSLTPNDHWSQPERVGTNAVRATASSDSGKASAAMVLSSSAQGTVGKICVTRVPKGGTPISVDTLAQMMSSLQFNQKSMVGQVAAKGTPAAAGQPVIAPQTASGMPPTPFSGYRKFFDPSENAFSIDVPVGWQVTGGLYRPQSIDARPWVKCVSPDNLMVAFFGDASIPPYSVPSAISYQMGYGIGSRYGGGEVRPYVPANRFVEQYARKAMKKDFKDVRVVEQHEHPEVASYFNGSVGATRSEASSIKVNAMYGNIPAVGYFLASTKETVQSGAGMWWVTIVAGVLCPADRQDGGLSVILHMIQTFRYNDAWKGQSVANAGQVSRNFTAASQAAGQALVNRYWSQQAANDANHAAYWGRQAVQDHAADNFSDYIRGQQTVQDPNSGKQYKVDYGPNYHYMDQSGNIVGTQYGAPDAGWHQLLAVP